MSRALLHFSPDAEQRMAMPQGATRRHWTPAAVRELIVDWNAWPRYELIDGELLVTPSPGNRHQVLVTELLTILHEYVAREQVGIALASPADLELLPNSVAQPDVFVIPRSSTPPAAPSDGWANVKALLLAVEVISPGSVRADRVIKRDYYMDAGVPEYWIVDGDVRAIERWTPSQDTPTIVRTLLEWRPAGVSQPLSIDVPRFFAEVQRKIRLAGL